MLDLIAGAVDLTQHAGALLADVPDPGQGEAPPGSEKFTVVLKWAVWIVTALGVLGIIIIGGKLAIDNQRGRPQEHGMALGLTIVGCILATIAAQVVRMFI
ncbi:hypothetical protein [Kocuria sp. HSID16901]|uniref:hypothetical protein n=1 Tax=Kocuria sp. HSID16901 TaxID=2419505 RepID=UPI000F87C3D5|nr:hypothetical protein [Kocuria sp. HSID16901]RUQ19814.1 hypothetical protein D8M21_10855 [Kocuria sp. HSID16901]